MNNIAKVSTMMDADKRVYKFCLLKGGEKNSCPKPTRKSPYEYMDEALKDLEALQALIEKQEKESELENTLSMNKEDLTVGASKTKEGGDHNVHEAPVFRVEFISNSSSLYSESREKLEQKLKKDIELFKNKKITLKGYTDSLGPLKRNQTLAISRAEKVKTFLVEHGLKGEDIEIEGHPLSDYLNNNKTAKERKENRRVELFINLKTGGERL